MPVFSGVHGTSLTNAENINASGFVIPSFHEGQSKFGPGIYFYENNDIGRESALNWAGFRYIDESEVCILEVAFSYDLEKYIVWDTNCDEILASQLSQYCLENGLDEVPFEIENKMRVRIIDYLLNGIKPQVVFAKYPIIGKLNAFLNGCCVRDKDILPEPPYHKITKKNFFLSETASE